MAVVGNARYYVSIAGAAVALGLIGGGGWLWLERVPIAASYIDEMLEAKAVPARYRLARIGFRTHRIEAIRLGDPADPDLTADWAQIELGFGLSGVRVRAIDAGGVRLKGKLADGRLSLGAIDRLLPKSGRDARLALPDIDLTARAIELKLDTPAGMINARLDGAGGLRHGFRGSLRARADRLKVGECDVVAGGARARIDISGGRPGFVGPLSAASVSCPDIRLARPHLMVALRGSPDLTRWQGQTSLSSGPLIGSAIRGDHASARLAVAASPKAIETSGNARLYGARRDGALVDQLRLTGRYRFAIADRAGRLEAEARVEGARLAASNIAAFSRWGPAADGTPIGPVLAAWSGALERAARRIDAVGHLQLSHGAVGATLRMLDADLTGAGGGRLSVRGQGDGMIWRWPERSILFNGSAWLTGGGLPAVRASIRQASPGVPLSGELRMQPYRAGDADLRLAPVALRALGGRTLVSTVVEMDGPLADGRVEQLRLPVALQLMRGGAFRLNQACTVLSFDRATLAGARVGRTRLPLCPLGGAMLGRTAEGRLHGGASLSHPRLRGRLAGEPLSLEATRLTVGFDRPGFGLDRLALRLGQGETVTRLDAGQVTGLLGRSGIAGRFGDLSGKIGAVPLEVVGAAGDWKLASSRFSLAGSARIEDSNRLPRLNPLAARDIRLTLAGGRIDMHALLDEPASGRRVASIGVAHDLSSGSGDARIDVDRLHFGKGLQPEAITPRTLGIIANVEGDVSGHGHIRWAGGTVSSEGRFSTDGLNLAAAFGPVTALKGTISFTDLLGMVTAPDQQVSIAEINPGVAVTNGVIRYRILPDQKLDIADGRWPFAGGTLRLDRTLIDMGQPVERRLTFRIDGLDAAIFVQQLEFKNISVTGKFDGVLPIIFDDKGGRIENGFLAVRPGGGTLSYVGDVTNADLGRVAQIAFDALKSMRYDRLTIDLNGSLDGEIVSQVRFDGTNSDPVATARRGGLVGRLLAPVTRLPFRFRITITAPFRGLVNSAQTFVDPSILLRNGAARAMPAEAPLIQQR